MRILLTGATGFIGRAVLAELTAHGHDVYALIRSRSRLYDVMKRLPSSSLQYIIPILGDLTRPRLGVSAADYERIAEADIILHAGGPMNIQLHAFEAEQAFLIPARSLADLAVRIQQGKGLKQFIHLVGYMSPYNEENALEDLDDTLLHAPPYERYKFLADGHIRKVLHTHAITLSTVNPSVVIGDSVTGMTEQLGGLGILVDAVRRGLMPVAPGGNRYWLPAVHVDHVASFAAKLVRTEPIASDTYYLLDRQSDSYTMHEWIGMIAAVLHTRRPIGSLPPAFIQSLLRSGLGHRFGIPPESMSFIVNRDFPVSSKAAIEQLHGMRTSVVRDTLPYVIADVDYRLSHPTYTVSESFAQQRRAQLITLERSGSSPGKDNRPAIIFLHGTFSNADRFIPIAEQLADYPTVLVDLPGFGRSPSLRPIGASRIEDDIDAVIELILEHKKPVVLIGHSFGGLIAAKVMERIEPFITKLILLQPVLAPRSGKYRVAAVTKRVLKRIKPASIVNELRKGGDFQESNDRRQQYVGAVMRDLRSPRIRHANAAVMSLLTQPGTFDLQPQTWDAEKVKIILGSRDESYKLPASCRRFQIVSLPYGHQFPIEAPLPAGEWIRRLIP